MVLSALICTINRTGTTARRQIRAMKAQAAIRAKPKKEAKRQKDNTARANRNRLRRYYGLISADKVSNKGYVAFADDADTSIIYTVPAGAGVEGTPSQVSLRVKYNLPTLIHRKT